MTEPVRIYADVTTEPIDEAAHTAALGDPAAGAVVTFVGVVRNHHEGRAVDGIEYACYESMARRELASIAREASGRWPLAALRVVHRVGELGVGEASLYVGASSAHRAEAFDAVRYVVEEIKRRVPVWKHERYRDGTTHWV